MYRIFPNKRPVHLQNFYDFRGLGEREGGEVGRRLLERGVYLKEIEFWLLTVGSFLFSMFLNYNSISMRSSSESLGSMRLLFVFASSVSLSVISKGLLLIYSASDNRFYCSFNISKPLALPSSFKFNRQLLNDLMIWFFSNRFQDSKIHSTAKCREAGFIFPV